MRSTLCATLRRRGCLAFVVVAAMALAATPRASRAQESATPRPLGRDLPTFEVPADASAPPLPPAPEEPTGTLTLAGVLRAAASRSPVLAAFSWEVRARDAELYQSRAFPNPELATEVEDFAGSGDRKGFDGSQTTLSFAQLIELGGKRAKRMRAAELERDLATWDFEATRLAVLTDTTKAFVATLALQERAALSDELLRIANESLATVRAAVRAGATSPVEASRAAVAAEQVAIERERASRALEAARFALAATWGARAAQFDRVSGDLASAPALPAYEALSRALAENPDLARWSTEVAAREAALARERAQRVPDVTIALGPRYYAEGSSSALVAGFSVPLPLWNRNRGGILSAVYRLKRAAAEQAAAEVAAEAQLKAAYEALAVSRAEVNSLRERVLPAAESAYAGALSAYRTGRFRYLEVLDAQRTLFEIRGREIDALAAYHDAAADLERLTGTPLAELAGRP